MGHSTRRFAKSRLLLIICPLLLILPFLAPAPAFSQQDESGQLAEDVPATQSLNEWFDTYINEPLWNYFLGYPLFQREAIEVYRGGEDDASSLRKSLQKEGIVVWKVNAGGQTALHVPVKSQQAAAQFLRAQGVQPVTSGQTSRQSGIPFIVLVLVFGGVFFTLRYAFINLRLFRHGIACTLGKYDKPGDKGEIAHFKALSSALSATVGLGNIAGVAVAISAGGPGAVFWMWITAFFGMSVKFADCTMAQLYRRISKKDGHVLGGPMIYLDDGVGKKGGGWKGFGKTLAILYAIFTICSAFSVGMFQGKVSYGISAEVIPAVGSAWVKGGYGVALAILVGIVIIGGIKRIGQVTSRLVPAMCIFYVTVCLLIILGNFTEVPRVIGSIFYEAFSGSAVFGGFLGVLVWGLQRGAFSNEAGLGSAAIAHAAARTGEPVREGLVAMLGPFIDTLVICTMTALAILITGVHQGVEVGETIEGAVLTATAFASLHELFAYLLVPAVLVFAYSTLISWSYYGERATEYMLGVKSILPFKVIFIVWLIVSPHLNIDNILGFADIMFLSMVFPNVIGMIILSGEIKRLADDYTRRLKNGEIRPGGK